jgi:hypothetical protein
VVGIQLNGVAEAVGVVERITDVLLGLLLLFNVLHYSGEF